MLAGRVTQRLLQQLGNRRLSGASRHGSHEFGVRELFTHPIGAEKQTIARGELRGLLIVEEVVDIKVIAEGVYEPQGLRVTIRLGGGHLLADELFGVGVIPRERLKFAIRPNRVGPTIAHMEHANLGVVWRRHNPGDHQRRPAGVVARLTGAHRVQFACRSFKRMRELRRVHPRPGADHR